VFPFEFEIWMYAMNKPYLYPLIIEEAVRAALAEDIGRAGDITSIATIPADMQARCVMAPRKSGVICGLSVAEAAFKIVDPSITFEALAEDGEEFPVPRTPVARITGNARAILTAERTALNFISHMSGIATQTAKFVDLVKHTNAKICCTRKTTPNLRAFEKYAIRCGGGLNHRFGLDDAFLIKDNHIAVCGGIKQALQACKAHAGHLVKIEIEVDGLDQLREVIEEGADVVQHDAGADGRRREDDRRQDADRSIRRHQHRERQGSGGKRRRHDLVRRTDAFIRHSGYRPRHRTRLTARLLSMGPSSISGLPGRREAMRDLSQHRLVPPLDTRAAPATRDEGLLFIFRDDSVCI
jgi:nicotinate-nucleotide pyrophosphorylase (carboxylating)